jgi:hypothetical protein
MPPRPLSCVLLLLACLSAAASSGCQRGQCDAAPPICMAGFMQRGDNTASLGGCPENVVCYEDRDTVCGNVAVCVCVGDTCTRCNTDADCPAGTSCQPPVAALEGVEQRTEIPAHCATPNQDGGN